MKARTHLVVLLVLASPAMAGWVPVSSVLDESQGALHCLLTDPGLPDTWIIGTNRGLLVSTDGGASFAPRPCLSSNHWIRNLVQVDDEPGMLFALAYISEGGEPVHRLFRTTDRGLSWASVCDIPNAGGWQLAAATSEGSILLASHSWSYGCSGDNTDLYRSTDGGLTWDDVLRQSHGTLHPQAGSPVMYFRSDYAYNESAILYRSTDRGATWIGLPSPFPSVESYTRHCSTLAVGGPTGHELLALGGGDSYGLEAEFMASTDLGETWWTVTGNLRDFGLHLEGTELICSSNGIATFFRAAGYPLDPTGCEAVRSTDGGRSWLPASWGLQGLSLATSVREHHRLVQPWWDPGTTYALLRGLDGVRLYKFIPGDAPPLIPLAGWVPDRIDGNLGGTVKLMAYALDPDGDEVEVDLLYQGLPTGLALEHLGGGLFALELEIQPGAISRGYQAIALRATDSTGRMGPIWPFLHRGQPGSLPTCEPPPWREMYPFDTDGPALLAGGWGFSQASGWAPDSASLVVLAGGPGGLKYADLVELLWQGYPTGWILERGYDPATYFSYDGAFSSVLGCHGSQLTFPDDLPYGSFYLELMARDELGHHSGLWPYLTVE